MKGIHLILGRALVLTGALLTVTTARADSGYTVTGRGPDWKVLQKTTVENGTNHVHRYVQLETGLNYTNSAGQLVESSDQITLLPTGGAIANQGRHTVSFPADIYNGVLTVTTPDGRILKSRPLGVSFDDGSNTVFIATLKSAQGYLTGSNTVVYRDAFDGISADLVCKYKRSGFECDLVVKKQIPTPGDYNLDGSFSTLQMVTEFFNTADPEQIPAASDDWFGLQDTTLKFGQLTMTHGRAFAFKGTNSAPQTPDARTQTPVYKSWVHAEGRTFLIESVPVLDLAEDLNALPLTASIAHPGSRTTHLASRISFPPAHGIVACTNQILLATADVTHEPGVVLDYTTIDSGPSDFTFTDGTTYFINGGIGFDGTTTFTGGAIIKMNSDGQLGLDTVACNSTADHPTIFTSVNDDSVGDPISGSSGSPYIGDVGTFLSLGSSSVVLSNMDFYYGSYCITAGTDLDLWNCRFVPVDIVVASDGGYVGLHNVLIQGVWLDNPISYASYAFAENVTVDGCLGLGAGAAETNCLLVTDPNENEGIPFVPGGGVYVRATDGGTPVYSATSIFCPNDQFMRLI
jgi:hypothetical protein